MVILGIDPGIATTGYGVCEYDKVRFLYRDCGVIETAKGQRVEARLAHIYKSVCQLIETYRPDALAIEELFYYNNQKTVINVAQARGVVLLAAEERRIPIAEYTPLQVKQSVVGYGRAEKRQVQEMARIIFRLPGIPKPDDAADALAIAVCHGYRSASRIAVTQMHNLADSKKTGGQ
ncbi:MAG: crossover junction endodeoxyribonuclease RuvC [Clostridia bacterium]|nr:crossover junction endodeoxyribonuclease RuvC [Clostridia bacterium]